MRPFEIAGHGHDHGGEALCTRSTVPRAWRAGHDVRDGRRAELAGQASATAGYGATEREWNAAHRAAAGFPSGSAYDSDPSLPRVEGHAGARYTEVHRADGRILSYVYHFPGAPIAAAQRGVLGNELPPTHASSGSPSSGPAL